MTFDARQILFLQGLVEERPTQRSAGKIAKHFCEHFSLGQDVGRCIEYRTEHHSMALSLLQAHDLPVKKPSRPGCAQIQRSLAGSQKSPSVWRLMQVPLRSSASEVATWTPHR